MRSLKCHISGDKVLSPGVGRYYCRIQKSECESGWKSIGVLLRLDECWNLLIPEIFCMRDVIVPDGAQTMAGDVLATSDMKSNDEVQSTDLKCICAPADGFVRIVDGCGREYKHSGDRLHCGDVIAILELMKIRMEIEYSGAEGCEFGQYVCADQTAVRKGMPIAEYRIK